MNITINNDGSVRIETTSYSATYHANGNLKFSMVGKAPEKITINYPKKEIGELIYKVSVDTSELDKLEEQLNRIKQLMQDIGVKPKSIPQSFFFQSSGEFKGVLVSNKSEQDINALLTDLRMQSNRQDVAINELKRVMETQHQAWSQAVSELNNRTWCSQK